jgi:site-specific recombinase XerD
MGNVRNGAVKDALLFGLVHDFLKVYLPTQRNSSPHTIKAYRFALGAFLDFAKTRAGVPLAAVTFEMIDSKALSAYLDEVEAGGGSVTTRNHRLAAIRAFYAYSAMVEPAAVAHCDEIRKVPVKKGGGGGPVGYMSEAAVSAVLAQPDATTRKGLRDQFMLLVFYDTAARISEVLNIRLRDIRLGDTPTVTLFGKGRKARTVPLSAKTVEHLRNYSGVFHPGESAYSDRHLFYTTSHGRARPMGETAVRDMMTLHCDSARAACADVPPKIFPHLWRHSRAMHLYQHGMDLTLLAQWLGHSNLETVLVYAHADTEHKRRAIEAAVPPDSPMRAFTNAERFTVTDDDTLKRLYGLK